LEKQNSEKPK